jgi:hypothetical protein
MAAAPASAAVTIRVVYDGVTVIANNAVVDPAAVGTFSVGSFDSTFSGDIGVYNFNNLGGSIFSNPLLSTQSQNSIRVTEGTVGAHSLDVFITGYGYTTLTNGFKSTFQTNTLTPAGWNLTEATWLNTLNIDPSSVGPSATNLLLAQASMTGPTTSTAVVYSPFVTSGSPYALATEFHLTTTGAGVSNSNITIAAIPEPTTWGMMIMGFGGIGALVRNRRRQLAFAA